MASDLEYAVMANDAYAGGDVELDRANHFPTFPIHSPPDGWVVLLSTRTRSTPDDSRIDYDVLSRTATVDPDNGVYGYTDPDFFAVAYQNEITGEVVIAYRGTTGRDEGTGDTLPLGNGRIEGDSAGAFGDDPHSQILDADVIYRAVLDLSGIRKGAGRAKRVPSAVCIFNQTSISSI